ncbi:DUF1707 and DUF2154 domain-containing protein [Streptomyces triticagri]|uniref:DUF1707 and DUF2154 domain-containing protein n=1 Tax=Streptomyces triticagri TaxID=2293568 RepID=A0A372M1L8_9ACTN|nr:DUF1707 domain-containing protein [Streptomyces triticagri]RFU84729.1 DUF1707 and DUF2154 domain-containing protein [Streptomyces triticagri]
MDLEKRPEKPEAPSPRPAAGPVAEADLRASDADRDRFADILRDAMAEGRLTSEEFTDRIEGVYRAKTVGELEPLVRDLPAARTGASAAPDPSPYRPAPIPDEPDENLVAVFSSSTRKGRWRVGRRTHAYSIFGNIEIDLTEAVFEHQQVLVKCFSIFGNVEITVPENITLKGSGSGVFGNFEVESLEAPDANAPRVVIDGYSVFGNIEAKPKRGKLVTDLHKYVGKYVDKHLRKHHG